MPLPALGLGALAAGFLARLFTAGAARWLAQKLLIFTLGWVVIPVALTKLFQKLMTMNYELITENMPSGVEPFVFAFTGLGAWVAGLMKIPEAVAVVLGAVATRYGLSLLPISPRGK